MCIYAESETKSRFICYGRYDDASLGIPAESAESFGSWASTADSSKAVRSFVVLCGHLALQLYSSVCSVSTVLDLAEQSDSNYLLLCVVFVASSILFVNY